MLLRRLTALTTTLAVTAGLLLVGPVAAHADTLPAPSTISTLPDTDGDVRLAWQPVPGASAYNIQISADPAFGTGTILVERQTYAQSWVPTSAIDTIGGRTLYWHVAAFGTAQSPSTLGAYSTTVALPRPGLPAPAYVGPADAATLEYPAPLTFAWQPVPGAVSYTLEYAADADFLTNVTTLTTTATSHTPATLLARKNGVDDITWSWHVRANFYTGSTPTSGPFTTTRSFVLTWSAAASRPVLTSPPAFTGTEAGISDLRFTWNPVPGASKYKISVAEGRDATQQFVGTPITFTAETTGTTYIPDLALADTEYYWQVTAYDAAGNAGTPSILRSFNKVWGAQTEPTAEAAFTKAYPIPLVGTSNAGAPTPIAIDRVTLSWQPVARATLYEVQVVPLNGDPRLTCRTASTTVNILPKVDPGVVAPSSQSGSAMCLWTSNVAQRIQPGRQYSWRVRAIDYSGSSNNAMQATTLPTGTLVSAWSDPETTGSASRARYFTVTAQAAASGPFLQDTAAWATQTTTAMRGQAAPVFEWSAVDAANAYAVDIATDIDFTTDVVRFYVPGTVLRPNGVFADKTSGTYFWRVRPAVTSDWNSFTFIAPWSAELSWQKQSTPSDFVGVTPSTTSGGTTVLAWRPQALSAPDDGGSRGYSLMILDSVGTVLHTTKVEYPFFAVKNPVTGSPLAAGTYKFVVAPLDANGTPGKYSAEQTFTVQAPAPTTTASTVGPSDVNLTWQAPAATAKFQVRYWNTATPGTIVKVPSNGFVLGTGLSIADLAPGTYSWQVQGLDTASNVSLWSDTQQFIVAERKPTLVTPDGTTLSTADRRLDWAPVPGASRYLVYVATTAGALPSTQPIETTSTSLVYPLALTFGTGPYYWQVRAVPELATSGTRIVLGESAVRTFSPRTVPIAPAMSTPALNGADIDLAWSPLTGTAAGTDAPVQYVVRYRPKTIPASTWTQLGASNAVALTVTQLAAGITYEFQVGAVSPEGQGPWSGVVERATATAPGVPGNLTVKGAVGGLTVSWYSPSTNGGLPLTGYKVGYGLSENAVLTYVTVGPYQQSLVLSDLAKSTSYYVTVAAVNAVGAGPAVGKTQASLALPSAPRTVTATRGDRSATLRWTPPATDGGSPVTGYRIEQQAYYSGTWSGWTTSATVAVPTPAPTTYSSLRTNLDNGRLYHFRVRAITGAALDGGPTLQVSVTPAGKPLAPTGVVASSTTGRLKVVWLAAPSNGSAVTGYYVQYSTTGSTWTSLAITSATTRSYTTTKGTKGKRYYLRVIAKNAVGLGTPSSSSSVVKK